MQPRHLAAASMALAAASPDAFPQSSQRIAPEHSKILIVWAIALTRIRTLTYGCATTKNSRVNQDVQKVGGVRKR
jgi:hypothetical protein